MNVIPDCMNHLVFNYIDGSGTVVMLCESMVDYIRECENAAFSVQMTPDRWDIIFKMPDRSVLMVPRPLYAEYCKQVRPLKINGINLYEG